MMETLNLIGTILMVVEIACATNPATIAISGILMVLSSILSIFSLVNNIKEIKELEKKKKKLEDYFKKGGQFDKDLKSIA
jgi:membrane-bound ClpP family serine protease